MARKYLSPDQVLLHPMRRAVLRHLVVVGGKAAAVETCVALGIKSRESLALHARLLARGDFVRVQQTGRGSKRKALLKITDKGAAAIHDDQSTLMLEFSS
jgi:hypothetical protein